MSPPMQSEECGVSNTVSGAELVAADLNLLLGSKSQDIPPQQEVDPVARMVFDIADRLCPDVTGPVIILYCKGKPYKAVPLADYLEAIQC